MGDNNSAFLNTAVRLPVYKGSLVPRWAASAQHCSRELGRAEAEPWAGGTSHEEPASFSSFSLSDAPPLSSISHAASLFTELAMTAVLHCNSSWEKTDFWPWQMPACLEEYAQFGVSIFWTHAKDTFVRGIWYVVVLLGLYGGWFCFFIAHFVSWSFDLKKSPNLY